MKRLRFGIVTCLLWAALLSYGAAHAADDTTAGYVLERGQRLLVVTRDLPGLAGFVPLPESAWQVFASAPPERRWLAAPAAQRAAVTLIDTRMMSTPRLLPLPRAARFAAFHPSGKSLWLTLEGGGLAVCQLDEAKLEWLVAGEVELPPGGPAATSGLDRDSAPGRVPGWPAVASVAFGADGTSVFALTDDGVHVIDAATRKPLRLIPTRRGNFRAVASPDGRFLYVANFRMDSVYVIDLAAGTILRDLEARYAPTGLALTRDGGTLFVQNQQSDAVVAIDGAAHAVAATLAFPARVQAMALDGADERLFVLTADGVVSVVDVKARRVSRTMPAGVKAGLMAVWPGTDDLLLASGEAQSVVRLSTRTGSAEVLAKGVASTGTLVVAGLVNRDGPALRPISERPSAEADTARFVRDARLRAASGPAPATQPLPALPPVDVLGPNAAPYDVAIRGARAEQLPGSIPIVEWKDLTPAERARLAPTPVTVSFTSAPPARAFAELSRQTGLGFVPLADDTWTQRGHPVTYAGRDVPMWAAVAEVARQTNTFVNFAGGGLATVSYGSPTVWRQRPLAVSGAFLLEPWPLTAGRWYDDRRAGGRAREVTLHVDASAEPRLWYVLNARSATVVDVVDETGRSFDFQRNLAAPYAAGRGAMVTFTQRDPGGKQVARVRGVIHALVALDRATARVDDCLNAPARELAVGPLTVGVSRAVAKPMRNRGFEQAHAFTLTVARGGRDKKQWYQARELLREMSLGATDATGRSVNVEFGGWVDDGGDGADTFGRVILVTPVTSLGRRPAVPQTLTLGVPTKLAEVDVPFVFRDLPLPADKAN